MDSSEQLQDLLLTGISELNLCLNDTQISKLMRYSELLIKWNKVYNLTSITTPKDIIIRHILDSLAVVKYITQALPGYTINQNLNTDKNSSVIKVLDVGSGGGIPGIILAIALDNLTLSFSLLDSNNKKTIFMKQAIIELGLTKSVTIINKRVEEYSDLHNIVISRAFSSLDNFVTISRHLLVKNGIILAMKAKIAKQEVLDFNNTNGNVFSIKQDDIYKLSVPFLNEERYLIKISNR